MGGSGVLMAGGDGGAGPTLMREAAAGRLPVAVSASKGSGSARRGPH